MTASPTVYLDSQDFSRFGDVLRGKSDDATGKLFTALEDRALSGAATFVASMPLLGELLQYDADFRETTFRKAEAIERLCGANAVAYPPRAIAIEVAKAAYDALLIDAPPDESVLRGERRWYPDVSDVFEGFRETVLDRAHNAMGEITAFNRNARRRAKKLITLPNIIRFAREGSPQFALEYGLPENAVIKSIVACLQDRATPQQASDSLFSAIAEPQRFVELYFERLESDRSLPEWISGMGQTLFDAFGNIQKTLAPLSNDPEFGSKVRRIVDSQIQKFEEIALNICAEDSKKLGVTAGVLDAFKGNSQLRSTVPACRIFSSLVRGYTLQVVGVSAKSASIERSFGGDLVHAFYIPHVDFWRSDRRFSALVKETLPEYSAKVIPQLRDLPTAIDAFRG
ncbi:hypothetical protein [Sphingobium tyrosinilyticum]|uniref:Uncharacterized protein n=1 Tax=Sphingobium tyrosinilyticum TaxID=2715436 RepID=A0ABV9F4D1_9SPHN